MVHNNADSMPHRPCHNEQCKYCDRYEQRYSPETIADFHKNAGKTGAVKRLALDEGNIQSEMSVSHTYIGSVRHDVVCPNDGDDYVITLLSDGTITKRLQSVSYQDKDPELIGSSITDDDFHGSDAHTTLCLGPGVAEMLSSEMSHEMSQIGVPHFRHATIFSVCNRVDAEAHELVHSRHAYCCCCCRRVACYVEICLDHPEDGSLFRCLFEIEKNPDKLNVADSGVTKTEEARTDKLWCPCENTMSASTPNSDNLQDDQRGK